MTKKTIQKKIAYEGPLYDLLKAAFPKCRADNKPDDLSIYKFARLIDSNTQAVYRWLSANRLPANRVTAIVDASAGKLTKVKLIDFVITD